MLRKHEIVSDCETKIGYVFGTKYLGFNALNATGDGSTLRFRLQWSLDAPPATKNDRIAILGDIMLNANLALKWHNNTNYDKGKPMKNSVRDRQYLTHHLQVPGTARGVSQLVVRTLQV